MKSDDRHADKRRQRGAHAHFEFGQTRFVFLRIGAESLGFVRRGRDQSRRNVVHLMPRPLETDPDVRVSIHQRDALAHLDHAQTG